MTSGGKKIDHGEKREEESEESEGKCESIIRPDVHVSLISFPSFIFRLEVKRDGFTGDYVRGELSDLYRGN